MRNLISCGKASRMGSLFLMIMGLSLAVMGQDKADKKVATAKSGSVEEILMKLERDAAQAALRRDVSFSEKMEAPDFLFIDPAGMVHTREEDLALARSRDLKFESMNIDDMKVRVYGDTAVVTGQSTVKGKYKDQDISGKYRWTDVFVKRKGEWQLVNGQLTTIQSMPETKP
jgi:ketosteroid isomerase-like protein